MSTTPQHALVTGGAGFVGSHLTRQLLAADIDVTVLDSCFTGRPGLVAEGATLREVDLRDAEAVTAAVRETDPTVIVHLAALHYIPYCNANPEAAFDVNVLGTRTLLEAARPLRGLERVVFASSAAVYPPAPGPHAETDPVGPTDIYGRTKLVGEDLLQLFALETGVPAVAARLFNVYGPDETNPHLIPAILEQLAAVPVETADYPETDREPPLRRAVMLGNLEPKRDFVHVTDVARALALLATRFDEGYAVYNVGTGVEWSIAEVVTTIEHALGEAIEVTQDAERVRAVDRPHLRADVARLRTDFGWEPRVGFEEGLADLLGHEEVTA